MTISLSERHPGFIFEPLICLPEAIDPVRQSHVHGRLAALAALAAATCLSGCAAYRPQQIDARRSLAAFEARRLDAPALRQYMEQALHHPLPVWPLPSWNFE